ncbi:aminotransferase class V-fold PLP-dependent enzyme [Tissierella sp. Yu-01]|uniref:aminotransferase class V-fold PLP-dependent enzyme n=1 Tax=Tissierella sp. Yu-01 TaxID=3035694 RepID=UPI00240D0DBB|nr:aminotransferase class V-fold PLP-dependent enzyme [Tissierella sp. Yu-01]WFA08109.1 aminotransferase class V-fold PLP-dependent enzyme [Tissierella sp. Yu-01]
MFKDFIVGSDSIVTLANGNDVHYINFDNAATTPPFKSVIQEIVDFAPNYSSVHRGSGYKSILSSKVYDDSRCVVLDFVNGNKDYHTVIFLNNTTDCINKLSYRLQNTLKDKIVLSTYMEHHSNMLPWRNKYNIDFIDVDQFGRLNLDDLEEKLREYNGRVGLVCVTAASNVTGYINPIHEIAKLAHKYGAKILVDGAQAIAHIPLNMKPVESPEHIDYLTFSAHKMYAPFGIGALIAPKDTFIEGCSECVGGGTVKFVSIDDVIWADPPDKEEAGTPNLMGVVALTESIKTLKSIGMDKIDQYERSLTAYALDKMRKIPDLIIYDDFDVKRKVSIISFNMRGLHHTQLAEILGNEGGIAVRNGCFCAQPYIQKILNIKRHEINTYRNCPIYRQPGMVRISMALYNDYNEIDLLVYLLNKISNNMAYYQNKYRNLPLE